MARGGRNNRRTTAAIWVAPCFIALSWPVFSSLFRSPTGRMVGLFTVWVVVIAISFAMAQKDASEVDV